MIGDSNLRSYSSWADGVPEDVLILIRDKCENLEVLAHFSRVCKSWRASASSKVQISPGRHPWLLVHMEGKSECLLLEPNRRHERYRITVPELQGTTCLASSQGWLLLSRKGKYDFSAPSLFFFNPFSRARLDLPALPTRSTLTEGVAAFSYTPTSCTECVVCVPVRDEETGLGVLLLSREVGRWIRLRLWYKEEDLGRIVCATWYQGKFWFGDKNGSAVWFCPRDRTSEKASSLPFSCWRDHVIGWDWARVRPWWGPTISISSTCGTLVPGAHHTLDSYIVNDHLIFNDDHHPPVTGIWLYPAGLFDHHVRHYYPSSPRITRAYHFSTYTFST